MVAFVETNKIRNRISEQPCLYSQIADANSPFFPWAKVTGHDDQGIPISLYPYQEQNSDLGQPNPKQPRVPGLPQHQNGSYDILCTIWKQKPIHSFFFYGTSPVSSHLSMATHWHTRFLKNQQSLMHLYKSQLLRQVTKSHQPNNAVSSQLLPSTCGTGFLWKGTGMSHRVRKSQVSQCGECGSRMQPILVFRYIRTQMCPDLHLQL